MKGLIPCGLGPAGGCYAGPRAPPLAGSGAAAVAAGAPLWPLPTLQSPRRAAAECRRAGGPAARRGRCCCCGRWPCLRLRQQWLLLRAQQACGGRQHGCGGMHEPADVFRLKGRPLLGLQLLRLLLWGLCAAVSKWRWCALAARLPCWRLHGAERAGSAAIRKCAAGGGCLLQLLRCWRCEQVLQLGKHVACSKRAQKQGKRRAAPMGCMSAACMSWRRVSCANVLRAMHVQ